MTIEEKRAIWNAGYSAGVSSVAYGVMFPNPYDIEEEDRMTDEELNELKAQAWDEAQEDAMSSDAYSLEQLEDALARNPYRNLGKGDDSE